MWLPLEIPPGVSRNGTDLQNAGRWRDASLVRWQDGAMQPVGGWRPRFGSGAALDLSGTPRSALAWLDNSGARWAAFACHDKLLVMSEDDVVSDITPAGLTAGRLDSTANFGWGGSTWGASRWGVERIDSGSFDPATVWHLDVWGENLVACSPEDGKLYEWTLDPAAPAMQIANAPVDCSGLVVTEDRLLLALGAGGDPRKVAWSDREKNTEWTPEATNEAGDFLLNTTGSIERGLRVRGETLILTSEDAYVAAPNASFVFSFNRVGTACGAIARGAAVATQQGAIWMSQRGFFRYFGGAVEEIPCSVSDYVFEDLNHGQASKVTAVDNSRWGEVWWFYPSSGSVENNSYVAYDMRENLWMIGALSRTAGFDAGVFRLAMWVDADGLIYEHETGSQYDGAMPFAESAPFSIARGERTFSARLLYPDERTQGEVQATFKTRFHANGDEYSYGPYDMGNPVGVRFAGRQVRMRVEGTEDWRVGVMSLEGSAGGRR